LEDAEITMANLPLDIWKPDPTANLQTISPEANFVVLFNVHLDNPSILRMLDNLFS
jgi:hypothetical protein